MNCASVELLDLSLGYNKAPAIQNITGTVREGALIALTGPNGSGKSTLLKGIAGILHPLRGACSLAPGMRVAYLAQSSELDHSFPATVRDLVSLGFWPERGLLRRYRTEDRERLAKTLDLVGLTGFENRSLSALSGGQLQRALFARVILQDAKIILLDEPFNAVDASTIRVLLELIKKWHAQKRTVIVVVHDIALIRGHFPETIIVNGELVAWGETSLVLDPELMTQPGCMQNSNRLLHQRECEK